MSIAAWFDRPDGGYPRAVVESLLVSKQHPRATFREAWDVALEFNPPPDSWGALRDPESPLAFLHAHCEAAWAGQDPPPPVDPPSGENVAERIAEARRRIGWWRKELAEVVGVSSCTVDRWETGSRTPDPRYHEQLALALDTTPEELFGEEAA